MRVIQKLADVAADYVQREHAQLAILGGDRIGVPLRTRALTVDRASVLASPEGGAFTVATSEVGSKDEDGIDGRRDWHRRAPGCCRSPRAVRLQVGAGVPAQSPERTPSRVRGGKRRSR